ncbi:class I SAM-dependent methyltransferase [Calothrix sp. 336/3]|uniref:class I SAM-dependent methyltransferase n=1 Tax=Calothrix sp. 336/3 TaxID=1337936 RepID=UPI0004E3A7F5|nr:class I SAM-dependent methyltransferase [Calothrix sp. 336/3]AKG21334.1 methyltransferase [Calothrix sp. 336/3]
MTLYDRIGENYTQTRKCDYRIADKILEILSFCQATTIVDIGAGTGSYALYLAERDCNVFAVEPSATMRSQAISHPRIKWIDGYAEKLPLSDRAVNAAIVILAFHHFQDYRQALREMVRVVGDGQIILFTYDPAMISRFWLSEYFPTLVEDVESTFVPIPQLTQEMERICDSAVNLIPFELPQDLSDSFAAVGWSRPELYLENGIRSGISSFAKMNKKELETGLSKLRDDLITGMWEQKYGYLRQLGQYDVGYRFIHTSISIS